MTLVCQEDGVPLVQNRTQRWLHTDSLPAGVDPDHEVVPVEQETFLSGEHERTDIHSLAAELIAHHVVMHPMSDCVFSQKLAQALRAKR